MASIWLPIFHPGAMALKTFFGVSAAALVTGMALPASPETLTVRLSEPHLTVTTASRASVVRLAPESSVTRVSWLLPISPTTTPHQAASEVTCGFWDEVTVNSASPPKRSKETRVSLTASFTCGMPWLTGIIRLCFSPMTRMLVERAAVPVFSCALTRRVTVLDA